MSLPFMERDNVRVVEKQRGALKKGTAGTRNRLTKLLLWAETKEAAVRILSEKTWSSRKELSSEWMTSERSEGRRMRQRIVVFAIGRWWYKVYPDVGCDERQKFWTADAFHTYSTAYVCSYPVDSKGQPHDVTVQLQYIRVWMMYICTVPGTVLYDTSYIRLYDIYLHKRVYLPGLYTYCSRSYSRANTAHTWYRAPCTVFIYIYAVHCTTRATVRRHERRLLSTRVDCVAIHW
jgi:hypothetical protein